MLFVIVSLYGPGQPSLLSKPHFPYLKARYWQVPCPSFQLVN